MSNIKEIIDRVDAVKPNCFHEAVKLRWVSLLDGKVAADIMLMDISELSQFNYCYPEDMNREPLVKFPHDDIYDAWLEAMIDYQNGEYNRYQNSMQAYNARYGEYLRWFAERYEPAQGNMSAAPDCHNGKVSYYITAYGLAVMRGYTGTLDEWLTSLKGSKGDKGDKGDPFAAFTIGEVKALAAGSDPTVTVTGSTDKPVLNFGIPGGIGGLSLKGDTSQIDVDNPLIEQGYYEIRKDAPVHGVEEGFVVHFQIIPGVVAAQLVVSCDAGKSWLRNYWKGTWYPHRQVGFGLETTDGAENLQGGQLFLVKV